MNKSVIDAVLEQIVGKDFSPSAVVIVFRDKRHAGRFIRKKKPFTSSTNTSEPVR